MKQSSYKGKSPLPDFVIDAACAGNAEAVERVLQHYDGYGATQGRQPNGVGRQDE